MGAQKFGKPRNESCAGAESLVPRGVFALALKSVGCRMSFGIYRLSVAYLRGYAPFSQVDATCTHRRTDRSLMCAPILWVTGALLRPNLWTIRATYA